MPSGTLKDFVIQEQRPELASSRTGISLFSGAGLSDVGYELSGFQFLVQVEIDQRRADIGSDNFTQVNLDHRGMSARAITISWKPTTRVRRNDLICW